jgi:CubicO group peptidase (beta-lactamase class C family)
MNLSTRFWFNSGRGGLFAVMLAYATFIAAAQSVIPTNQVVRSETESQMDAAITGAIATGKCPGGVLWVEQGGRSYHKAYGNRALVPAAETMAEDTIFDAASLTKVVACTPAVMLLVERGQLSLADRVAKHLPEFTGDGKEDVTIRHLITHTSGLRPDISLRPDWSGYDAAIKLSCAEKLATKPGEKIVYSDTGPILLGEIVRRVSGKPLDQFLHAEVYEPLGMKDTGFNPPKERLSRVAPTEVENGTPVRGMVHDPRARRMGGVAGHAGLFITASDLARYARMLLNGGELDGVRIFKPETVKLMTSVQTPPEVMGRRGLGWDIDTGFSGPRGELFPLGSYGHTGWTGTSIWIDPFSKTFVIFLSNRNHPTEKGSVVALRKQLGTLAAQWVTDFDFKNVPGALPPRDSSDRGPAAGGLSNSLDQKLPVLNGIDVLVKNNFAPLKGKRIGLITNHTGHDRARRATIDLFKDAPGVTLVALFGPEHGIRGEVDEKVGDSKDAKTGLPIYSLYGERRKPTQEQLKGLDALVFDIQDVGCRFYTYPATMGLCMEAAAEAGIEFIVLDRANPIDGVTIDGPVLTEKTSFVGFHPTPLRYAMTLGELGADVQRRAQDER